MTLYFSQLLLYRLYSKRLKIIAVTINPGILLLHRISRTTIKTMEIINFETIKSIIINMGMILLFSIIFVIFTNIISKRKRQIA